MIGGLSLLSAPDWVIAHTQLAAPLIVKGQRHLQRVVTRVARQLNREDIRIGRDRVARLMRQVARGALSTASGEHRMWRWSAAT